MIQSPFSGPTGRVLFIDFDGVLHPTVAIADLPFTTKPSTVADERGLMRWVPIVAELLAAHQDVRIVVHSAWRWLVDEPEIRELLAPLAPWYAGTTEPEIRGRHESILHQVHRDRIDDYLVLDDAIDEFPAGWTPLVVCDPSAGVSAADVQQKVRNWLG